MKAWGHFSIKVGHSQRPLRYGLRMKNTAEAGSRMAVKACTNQPTIRLLIATRERHKNVLFSFNP